MSSLCDPVVAKGEEIIFGRLHFTGGGWKKKVGGLKKQVPLFCEAWTGAG